MQKSIFVLTVIGIIATAMIASATIANPDVMANHEAYYRNQGIGFNDYDGDGRTCAATDYEADLWSDQFYNHHEISDSRTSHFQSCEAKEASYAGLPPAADNSDHIDNLIQQCRAMGVCS